MVAVVLPEVGSLALLASLVVGLFVGLLVSAVSVFGVGLVSGDLVTALGEGFAFTPGTEGLLLRGLLEPLSGEVLPDVEGVLGWGWTEACGGSFPAVLF